MHVVKSSKNSMMKSKSFASGPHFPLRDKLLSTVSYIFFYELSVGHVRCIEILTAVSVSGGTDRLPCCFKIGDRCLRL